MLSDVILHLQVHYYLGHAYIPLKDVHLPPLPSPSASDAGAVATPAGASRVAGLWVAAAGVVSVC